VMQATIVSVAPAGSDVTTGSRPWRARSAGGIGREQGVGDGGGRAEPSR